MIYNPILDLNTDETIVTVLTRMIADDLQIDNVELNQVILRGRLARYGVWLSDKRIQDIWLFRQGWLALN